MSTRIGFSTAKGISGVLSWLICRFSNSIASHIWFLYFDESFKMDMVMEASEFGFRLIPFDVFRKQNKIVKIYLPARDVDSGMAAAAAWLGSRYDFAGLFGMIVVEAGRALRMKWKNPFHSIKTQFCSEAVCRALRAMSYPQSEFLEPGECDPMEIMTLLEKTGSVEWRVA